MIKFYYSGAPNPTKIALFLEEAGLPYEPIAVDTRKGDQHKPEYLAINPNAKVPAIVDGDAVLRRLWRGSVFWPAAGPMEPEPGGFVRC